jgi:hypothetical protein
MFHPPNLSMSEEVTFYINVSIGAGLTAAISIGAPAKAHGPGVIQG